MTKQTILSKVDKLLFEKIIHDIFNMLSLHKEIDVDVVFNKYERQLKKLGITNSHGFFSILQSIDMSQKIEYNRTMFNQKIRSKKAC